MEHQRVCDRGLVSTSENPRVVELLNSNLEWRAVGTAWNIKLRAIGTTRLL